MNLLRLNVRSSVYNVFIYRERREEEEGEEINESTTVKTLAIITPAAAVSGRRAIIFFCMNMGVKRLWS